MRSRTLIPQSEIFYLLSSADSVSLGRVVYGLLWSATGVVGLTFPEASRARVLDRLRAAWPRAESMPADVAPTFVREAVDKIDRYLRGEPISLHSIRLDLSFAPPFHRKVYEAMRRMRRGSTISYGELAREVGSPHAARAIGQAMARNRIPIVVPCHRVLTSTQKLGGFTAPGGLEAKQKLLRMEGLDLPALS
ncbi:MAG: methylated-DNA--[protein]-cysteine S-methyltransferase [Bdellovibrionaceae bacterium]|nr:methylated-DNA--[protein]-cysteine S-methyltransferase [Pseudobdellovibrionaceae bacterium]